MSPELRSHLEGYLHTCREGARPNGAGDHAAAAAQRCAILAAEVERLLSANDCPAPDLPAGYRCSGCDCERATQQATGEGEPEFADVEAQAEAWSDRVEIQDMVAALTGVFEERASPKLMSRFRQQVMAVIQQGFIEGVQSALSTQQAVSPEEGEGAMGEHDLVDWFHQFVDHYVEQTNGPDSDALIAVLDRVRDSYRLQRART